MSPFRVLSLFLICITLFLGSCSKEDSTSPSDTNNQNTNTSKTSLTAKIDGIAWSPGTISAAELTMINRIAITAANFEGSKHIDQMNLTIDEDVEKGSYILGFSSSIALSYTKSGDSWTATVGKGTVVVTRADADAIEGTITATLGSIVNPGSKKELTEGKFYIDLKTMLRP